MRPRLIPIYDAAVDRTLALKRMGLKRTFWQHTRDALRYGGVKKAELLRKKTELPSDTPLLRVIDAGLWMLSSTGNPVKSFLDGGKHANAEFVRERGEFWKAVHETDPVHRRSDSGR